MKIELRDPRLLKPLPQIKSMPRFAAGTDEFNGAVDDVRENGIKHPLQITEDNLVVDGESRRLWAVNADLAEVPCEVVSVEDAIGIVLRELNRRRNLSKGARAYIAAELFQDAVNEGLRRKGQNLRKGQSSPISNSVGNGLQNAQELAASMGISDELYLQALKLHKLFAKDAELRAEWEPKILDPEHPVGLGAAIAGIAGADAAQPNRARSVLKGQLELFGDCFEDLRRGAGGWKNFDEGQKEIVLQSCTKTVKAMPADLRAALLDALKADK